MSKEFKLKIIDETFENLESKIQLLWTEFFQNIDASIFIDKEITIKVAIDFEKDYLHNSTDTQRMHLVENEINSIAVTILPTDDKFSKFLILLRRDTFYEFQYYSTLYHEFTHLVDFIKYFIDKQVNVFIQSEDLKQTYYHYYEFYFWTEFNAKKAGISRLKKELDKEGYKISLEQSCKNFIEDVNSETIKFRKLYHLVHFFARVTIYDSAGILNFSHNIFPREFIIKVYGPDAISLYKMFRKVIKYEDFIQNRYVIEHLIYTILG